MADREGEIGTSHVDDPGRPRGRRYDTIDALLPLLGDGRVSAETLTADCLAAIRDEDLSGAGLNAIRAINPQAMERARALDQASAMSQARGHLHGIPLLLKDNIDIAGMPTTSGCRALAGAMPWRNAGVVTRLNAAGAVIVAKTNLSEFSFEIRSRSSLGGDVLNPFNRSVTAGGSSGGAAAAVAAGFAVAAVGTDTGGSIRTPAAFNGLVGLRPTLGLIDRSGVAPLAPSTDTVGTLTRSVADAARLLAVLTDTLVGEVRSAGPALAGPRIGVMRQAFGVDPWIIAAMETMLAQMADDGATIIDPAALPDFLIDFGPDHVVEWEFRPAFDDYLATNFQQGAAASVAAILASGEFLADYRQTLNARAAVDSLDHETYRGILAAHDRLRRGLADLFDQNRLDALVYPTSAVIPTSLENPRGGWAPELAACSGRPAVTLPVAQAANGIPFGFEMLGRPFEEARLLELAAAVERRVDRRWWPNAA